MNGLPLPAPAAAGPSRFCSRRGPRVALAACLALHALLISSFHQPRPAPASSSRRSVAAVALWLRPAPAPLAPHAAATPERAPSSRAAPPHPRQAAGAARSVPAAGQLRQAVVDAPARDGPDAADPLAGSAAVPQPAFDYERARGEARRIAAEPDPSRSAGALARLPAPALAGESTLARGMAAGKRADCKDGVPGKLLAPLLLLLDKKDTGCKW